MVIIDIIATGQELNKEGVRAIEPVLEELINSANDEIQILTYTISPSALYILKMLERKAEKGITVTLVVNRLETFGENIKQWIKTNCNTYPHVRVVNFSKEDNRELHAKVIVVDRKKAIVGSANLSWGGMAGNYEIGVLIHGEIAWKLAKIIDQLVI